MHRALEGDEPLGGLFGVGHRAAFRDVRGRSRRIGYSTERPADSRPDRRRVDAGLTVHGDITIVAP
jgi:hypothetical protein